MLQNVGTLAQPDVGGEVPHIVGDHARQNVAERVGDGNTVTNTVTSSSGRELGVESESCTVRTLGRSCGSYFGSSDISCNPVAGGKSVALVSDTVGIADSQRVAWAADESCLEPAVASETAGEG